MIKFYFPSIILQLSTNQFYLLSSCLKGELKVKEIFPEEIYMIEVMYNLAAKHIG